MSDSNPILRRERAVPLVIVRDSLNPENEKTDGFGCLKFFQIFEIEVDFNLVISLSIAFWKGG